MTKCDILIIKIKIVKSFSYFSVTNLNNDFLHCIMTKTRIVAMIVQDERLLMEKGEDSIELWTPGGKLEEGESDIECLRRELREELCVDLVSAKFFKEYHGFSFYNPDMRMIQRVHIVTISGTPKPDAEIESVIFLSKEDFEQKKYPMIPINEEDILPDIIKAGVW